MICDLKPREQSGFHFNFDGTYKDQETDLSYRLNVRVNVTGKHQMNCSKKFINGEYGSIRTESKPVAEHPSFNMIEFSGERFGVSVSVRIPQIALTHKYTAVQKSKGPRRLGHMMLHDKHGVQEVTSVVSGGRVSPK